jgi:hypothetical protein
VREVALPLAGPTERCRRQLRDKLCKFAQAKPPPGTGRGQLEKIRAADAELLVDSGFLSSMARRVCPTRFGPTLTCAGRGAAVASAAASVRPPGNPHGRLVAAFTQRVTGMSFWSEHRNGCLFLNQAFKTPHRTCLTQGRQFNISSCNPPSRQKPGRSQGHFRVSKTSFGDSSG